MRKPLFFLALALLLGAVLVEIGSIAFVGAHRPDAAAALEVPRPGRGIPSLALLDGLVLFTIVLMGISLLIPQSTHARLQGCATLLLSLLDIGASCLLLFAVIALLVLMLTLIVALPFGPLVYLALFGDFDRTGAAIALALLMALKLGFAACLLLAHPRFLQNKGLVLIVLTSLVATLVVAFLHGLVPTELVSITDAIAAIVVLCAALAWALLLLVRSIPAIVKALRPPRA